MLGFRHKCTHFTRGYGNVEFDVMFFSVISVHKDFIMMKTSERMGEGKSLAPGGIQTLDLLILRRVLY